MLIYAYFFRLIMQINIIFVFSYLIFSEISLIFAINPNQPFSTTKIISNQLISSQFQPQSTNVSSLSSFFNNYFNSTDNNSTTFAISTSIILFSTSTTPFTTTKVSTSTSTTPFTTTKVSTYFSSPSSFLNATAIKVSSPYSTQISNLTKLITTIFNSTENFFNATSITNASQSFRSNVIL